MNRTIAQITSELEAAELLVRGLRTARSEALLAACPHKVGSTFTHERGGEFKVRSVSPAAKGPNVWLHCNYKTTAGKWSQGTRIIDLRVSDA